MKIEGRLPMWGLKEEKIMDRRNKIVFSLIGRTGTIDTQYILHKWYKQKRYCLGGKRGKRGRNSNGEIEKPE